MMSWSEMVSSTRRIVDGDGRKDWDSIMEARRAYIRKIIGDNGGSVCAAARSVGVRTSAVYLMIHSIGMNEFLDARAPDGSDGDYRPPVEWDGSVMTEDQAIASAEEIRSSHVGS